MRRLTFFLLLAVLTLTMAVSVMAFKTTRDVNAATISVLSTDVAALAVIQVDTTIASYVNNQLQLNFPAQQPDSTYTYNSVFKVKNRTPATITVSVAGVAGEASPGVHLRIVDSSTGTVYWQNGASVGTRNLTSMQEATMNVSVILDSGTSTGTAANLAITVQGQ